MTTTPKTGAPELLESQADKEESVNEGHRRIEAGASFYLIEDNDLTSPPGACADGAQYIVAATGSGLWAGHTGQIAIAVGTNAANGWYFRAQEEGLFAWIKDENALFYCDVGSSPGSWAAYTASGGGGLLAANNLSDVANAGTSRTNLGLGTVAVLDETTTAQFLANTADKALSTDQVWTAADQVTLTDAATIAVDMATFINAKVTLAGNRTLGNPSNVKGQSGCIEIIQDGTGTRTMAYASNWEFASGSAPTLSTAAGTSDLLFYQVISATRIFASLVKAVA